MKPRETKLGHFLEMLLQRGQLLLDNAVMALLFLYHQLPRKHLAAIN